MKRKWVLLLAAALAAALGIFSFREALMVRLFPKVVLSGAITSAFEELDDRFADSPMHLLAGGLDPAGCQRVHLKLDTETQFMGAAHYDLLLQTQMGPNRIQGEGTVSTGAGIIDLKLYLDENFAAVSSDGLTEGTYYGITYETFPEDIRQFPLLDFLVGDQVLAQWDASVSNLASMMGTSLSLPEFSEADIRTALLGALVLKPQVSAEEGKNCYAVAFTASGQELAEKAEPYLTQAPKQLALLLNELKADPESKLNVVFHLNKRRLTGLDVSLAVSGKDYTLSASLEEELLGGSLILRDGSGLERWEAELMTHSDGNAYREKLIVTRTRNAVQTGLTADYAWDLSSGDMTLEVEKDGKKHAIRLNLKGERGSFTITCQEFEKLTALFSGKEDGRPAIGTMTVSPGGPVVQVSDYKNISAWSMEDLYLLLKRIGGLVGIKLP